MSQLIDKANHCSQDYNMPHLIPDLIPGFFSSNFAVVNMEAIATTFCKATPADFVGSIIPLSTMFTKDSHSILTNSDKLFRIFSITKDY